MGNLIYITRRERFNAAHRLFRPDWSDEENFEVYGKCSNKNWHGHNYELYITIKGCVNPNTGFVVNMKDLSVIIKRSVIDKIDHMNLNMDVDFLSNTITSAENIVMKIWDVLQAEMKQMDVQLHCIKLKESENNYVEYKGENCN